MKLLMENFRRYLKESVEQIITFDFDDTLKFAHDEEFQPAEGATPFLREAKNLANQFSAYIVSTRLENEENRKEIENFISETGLKVKDVFLTNGDYKWKKLIDLHSTMHFDDDEDEWKLIEENAPSIKIGKINWKTGELIRG